MRTGYFTVPRCITGTIALLTVSMFTATAVPGSTVWAWDYTGPGVTAGGTFTTNDTSDANGGFLITGITGTRNGSAITGLQSPGTAIPGNEPFAVDDLVFLGPGPQLTVDGFGFSTADGNFSNPFFADFLPTPGYLEFFSTPPFTDGGQGPGDSELSIDFSATPVPEPTPLALLIGVVVIGASWRSLRTSGHAVISLRSQASARRSSRRTTGTGMRNAIEDSSAVIPAK